MSDFKLIQRAKLKGSDEDFLAWVRTMPSILTGTYSEYVNGEGRNEACHVRRVHAGAGTAYI